MALLPADFPLIQVAGVIDAPEADMLVREGVKFLGFPLRLTVNKEDLTEAEAAALVRSFPSGVRGVLITYLDKAADVLEFCRDLGVRTVQLHGHNDAAELP